MSLKSVASTHHGAAVPAESGGSTGGPSVGQGSTETGEFFQAADDYRALADILPQAICRKDEDGRYLFVNQRYCAWVGRASGEIIGKTDFDLFAHEVAQILCEDDRRAFEGGESFPTKYELPGREGVLTHVLRGPVRDDVGHTSAVYAVVWEESGDKLQKHLDLEQEIFLLRALMDTIPDSIYFKDRDSRFSWINRYTAAKFGIVGPAEADGKTDFDFFTVEHAGQAFRDEQEIIRTGRPLVNLEEKETLPDGHIKWASTTKMPLRDAGGRIIGTFGISRDITEKKHFEDQLAHQAFYDPLTQLPNRALFHDRLDHLFRRGRRKGAKPFLFSVIYLDLDRFKGVNDSLGHAAGDDLLVQFGRRLETCLRPGDTLARVGGDEFTVLLEDIASEADATTVAERIHRALTPPFNVNGTEIFSSASVGIALSSTGYKQPQDMLRDADTAMYRAKANGRSRHEVFDSDMHQRAVSLLQLETDLRRAVERGECRVYYQPIVDLATRRLSAFEALIRWQHPTRGMVMPDLFIPIAEETGLISSIGLWVLREACTQTRKWQRRFPQDPPLRICVNMSTRQLAQIDFVDQVRRTLEETDFDPKDLTLEMTESALMHNLKTGAAAIQKLHEMSVKLDIDDFGTGYSSLAYLQTFPVDTLKIDRSFVARMKRDEPGQTEIVRAIIGLAHNLGMEVTAEGVETAEQIEALQALNCTRAQGYFLSYPLPAEAAEALLARDLPLF